MLHKSFSLSFSSHNNLLIIYSFELTSYPNLLIDWVDIKGFIFIGFGCITFCVLHVSHKHQEANRSSLFSNCIQLSGYNDQSWTSYGGRKCSTVEVVWVRDKQLLSLFHWIQL